MRISTAVLAIAVALSAPFAGARAAGQPRTEAGVVAAETAWMEALRRRDTAALGHLLADDFVDTTWQGARRDKAAAMGALAAAVPQAQALSDLSVVLHGDIGICRGLNTVRAADGAVRAHIRFTDVFLYRDGGWRALSAQETLEQSAP